STKIVPPSSFVCCGDVARRTRLRMTSYATSPGIGKDIIDAIKANRHTGTVRPAKRDLACGSITAAAASGAPEVIDVPEVIIDHILKIRGLRITRIAKISSPYRECEPSGIGRHRNCVADRSCNCALRPAPAAAGIG